MHNHSLHPRFIYHLFFTLPDTYIGLQEDGQQPTTPFEPVKQKRFSSELPDICCACAAADDLEDNIYVSSHSDQRSQLVFCSLLYQDQQEYNLPPSPQPSTPRPLPLVPSQAHFLAKNLHDTRTHHL